MRNHHIHHTNQMDDKLDSSGSLKMSLSALHRGIKQGRFYVIKNTRMPAVLVEIGFLTGRLDARRLGQPSHRKRIAFAIAKGILEYLSKLG